jgi:HEAT repeat protein/ribosomal protein S17E
MKSSRVTYGFLGVLLCACGVCAVAPAQAQDDAAATILDELKRGDPERQAVVIAALREMPGAEITKALAKELPNLAPAAQVQLLSALGDRGDRAALPAVIAATKATDEAVRIAALKALGQLGDASSVMLLAQRAAASSGDEQKAARESLYRLRGPPVDKAITVGMQTVDGAILAGIPKADPKTRVELISSVGERNITAGVKTLLETATDPERNVRLESLRVLKTIASKADLPALVELLLSLQSDSDRGEAEKTIAAVAHKIPDKSRQAEAVLAVLPSAKDVRSQCSLLSVLGKIGDNSALPALRAALGSQDAKVQDAAIRALSEWPTAEPVLDLLKVAQSSDNKVHRILALRGFVRLLGLESSRPAEETIEMYKKAMSLAPDAEEKKKVLSGLANTKSFAAMQMAAGYLQDEDLHQEAEFAVVKIAETIYGSYPQESKDLLKKIIQTSKNDSLRELAQEVINQIERFDDYLTAWQASGPYTKEGTDGPGLFDVAFAPEQPGGQDVSWRVMPAGTSADRPWLMELDKLFGGDNRAAYLRTKVWSDKEQTTRLEIGSDDGIKVWLNGQLVHANNATRAVNPGEDKADVTLKQGWNQLLLKVTQGGGEWAVCARLCKVDGSKLEGLKVQVGD